MTCTRHTTLPKAPPFPAHTRSCARTLRHTRRASCSLSEQLTSDWLLECELIVLLTMYITTYRVVLRARVNRGSVHMPRHGRVLRCLRADTLVQRLHLCRGHANVLAQIGAPSCSSCAAGGLHGERPPREAQNTDGVGLLIVSRQSGHARLWHERGDAPTR